MYKVIKAFVDADDGHMYEAGDEFPRQGHVPEKNRVLELASASNRLGYPVIADNVTDNVPVNVPDNVPVKAEEAPKRRGRKKATEE